MIQKEEEELKNKLQADIKARYYQIGKNNRRLKVWNDGNGIAKNVHIVTYENSPLIPSDIEAKFPLDLESKQNVELLASVSLDTVSKHQLKIRWEDENGKKIEKNLTLTI